MIDGAASRSALVLYGSETGNAQDVALELSKICERLRFHTRTLSLNDVNVAELLRHSLVLISISTTGQGDLPANAQGFWRQLRSARLKPGCLSPVQFASFGLGDSSYPQFNWAHRKLYNRLVQLGAQPIYDRGEADEQHPEGVDGALIPWSLGLRHSILDQYPLPDGTIPIPDDEELEPKWVLDFVDQAQYPQVIQNGSGKETSIEQTKAITERPPVDLLDVRSGITSKIHRNERVTPDEHWQDVRLLTIHLPQQYEYGPGDVLTIYPKNFPSDVDHLLRITGWADIADQPLGFVATGTNSDDSAYPPPPKVTVNKNAPMTLRSLLLNHLDIISIPRRSFFASILHYTDDDFHRERLREFTDPQYMDELYDYTTRPRRSILEVLDEFASVKIPWQKVCSIIPEMRGRQFSIASGGGLKYCQHKDQPLEQTTSILTLNGPDHAELESKTSIELLIAIVKYRTVIKRIREGVATRYIASLQPGQQITVTLQNGSLGAKKDHLSKPVIMIGPGTGVAPMRSLIYERQSWRLQESNEQSHSLSLPSSAPSTSIKDLLFFGCRNENSDYFFHHEWEDPRLENHLRVLPAFSRDQKRKRYVQDLIREHAEEVFRALVANEGTVYVCGSSGKMPQAVREALLEVLEQQGDMSREEAEAYFAKMEKAGRYKQETW